MHMNATDSMHVVPNIINGNNPPTDLTLSRYGPASTYSTQWESCPLLNPLISRIQPSSMVMNACKHIYNILSSSSFYEYHHPILISSSSSSSSSLSIFICIN